VYNYTRAHPYTITAQVIVRKEKHIIFTLTFTITGHH